MADPLDSFASAAAFALSLPDTRAIMRYGKPAVEVAGNKRAFLVTGHEADTSFALAIDRARAEMLMATEPRSYWQSPHYAGSAMVLVRYDSADPERVRHVICEAHEQAASQPSKQRRR